MNRRIVLDANVWISAALKPESLPGNVVNLARDRLVQSVLSDALIDQVHRHLERLGFLAVDIARFEAGMRETSEIVSPPKRSTLLSRSRPTIEFSNVRSPVEWT